MISRRFKPLLAIIATVCFLLSPHVCFSDDPSTGGGGGTIPPCTPRVYGNMKGIFLEPVSGYVVAYSNGSQVAGQSFAYFSSAGACIGEFPHEYTIFNLSPGTYDFYIFGTGYVMQVRRNITIPCILNIMLERESLISGTVTVSGNAVGGVALLAYDSANALCGLGGITDATGSYTITGIPAGTYTIKAINPGYDFTPYQGVVTVGGQTTSGINLTGTATPPLPSGILSGTVSRVSVGTGIEGAFVTVYDAENKLVSSAETDADGHYEAQYLPAGTCSVKVDYGYVDIAQAQNVVVANDQTTTQDFSVSIGSISGNVAYSDLFPAIGVMLTAKSGSQTYSAKTGSDGHYAFNNILPGTYQINLFINGHFELRQIDNIVVSANSDITGQNFTITSVPTGQISGLVVGPQPQGPLVNAVVVAFNGNENPDFGSASTNADGIYTITGLPAGTYNVAASSNGYVSGSQTGVAVTAGQTSTGHNFTLGTEGGSISGTVYRPDGTTPVAGAMVSCYSPGKSTGVATTDENGVYSISLLQAGTYDVTAIVIGYKPKTRNNVTVTVPGTNSGNNFTLEAQ
jgi:hypothetical protein